MTSGWRTPAAAALALAVTSLAGCGAFAALFSTEPTPAERQAAEQQSAEQRAAEQARIDEALAAELEAARASAIADGATLEQVLAYADLFARAHESGAVARGVVAPQLAAELETLLAEHEAASAEAKEDRAAILLAHGRLLAHTGRSDEAAARWLEALGLGAPAYVLDNLAALPRTPTSDDAVVQACALVRPTIAGVDVPDFVGLCLDRAQGDRARLSWAEAERDLAAYDAEQRRLELEAEAEAEAAALRLGFTTAAVFAAGRCRFSDCAKEGWETSTDAGTVTTRCRFSDCFTEGWETTYPEGGRATTRCRFSKCLEEGWETDFPDGSSATTRCRFSDCAKEGWETSLPDGGTVQTRCRFSNCFEEGWETDFPDGSSVRCSCRFSNCLEEGTECS